MFSDKRNYGALARERKGMEEKGREAGGRGEGGWGGERREGQSLSPTPL